MLDSVETTAISLCVWLDPSFVAMCEQDGQGSIATAAHRFAGMSLAPTLSSITLEG
jgi:hypothetical protein